MTFFRAHAALATLATVVFIVSMVPVLNLLRVDDWQGVPPVYMDEYVYYSHVTEAGTGNVLFGNPYLLEHRFDPPLVLFGSTILAALPLLLGIPLVWALALNFSLWSLVFAGLYYRLVREFALPVWVSAGVALFAYLQSYDQIYRVGVRQEVFPFLLLFWIMLVRFIANPHSNRRLLWLGLATGATFYIYGFLWQTAVVTLGLLALYALATRRWFLLKRVLLASVCGGVLGAPAFLYTVWVTTQTYFWESAGRFGLVSTHVPPAEIIYSGIWAGVVVAVALYLWWHMRDEERSHVAVAMVFVGVAGLALWILQGSNLITGKLWETGDHLRRFIIVWLPLGTSLAAYMAYRYRQHFSVVTRAGVSVALVLLAGANIYFAYAHSHPFRESGGLVAQWQEQQHYAAPLMWLQVHEPEPVVVWGDSELFSTIHVPVLTQHYVLYVEPTNYMLLSNDEVRERYLVSRYFDGVSADSLKEEDSMLRHAGRANTYHIPQTMRREAAVCRLLLWWDRTRDCGTSPTPQQLLGDAYFENLADKFKNDITPNIKQYLKKYQVSYILKDTRHNPSWEPEALGGILVYKDGSFELYNLP